MKNMEFYLNNSDCHGGQLRNHRKKRRKRKLSHGDFHHLVFKVNRSVQPTSLRTFKTFSICSFVIRQYAKKFEVKITALSIQKDHIHLIIRTTSRSQYQSFFRVVAGQIAQRVTDTFHAVKFEENFWKFRPFTRIIRGRKAYLKTKAYVRLNELEVTGKIPYQKNRLKGLDRKMWALLQIDPDELGWIFYPATAEPHKNTA